MAQVSVELGMAQVSVELGMAQVSVEPVPVSRLRRCGLREGSVRSKEEGPARLCLSLQCLKQLLHLGEQELQPPAGSTLPVFLSFHPSQKDFILLSTGLLLIPDT